MDWITAIHNLTVIKSRLNTQPVGAERLLFIYIYTLISNLVIG